MAYLFYSDSMTPDLRLRFQLPFTNFYEILDHRCRRGCTRRSAPIVVVGTANAVNFTDGLDGLAIGPSIMNAGTFLVFAYIAGVNTTLVANGHDVTIAQYLHVAHITGVEELAIFCAALFGTGIGFLWYNAYPAQVFMGDVGSLSLGGAIGMMAVLTKNELVLLLVGGLFVVEALSSIIQTGVYKATRSWAPTARWSASACS